MPLKLSLKPYKDEILSWVSKKYTNPEILSKISVILYIECSLTTLERALRAWNISRNKKKGSLKVERIKSYVSKLFICNYNNKIIL
jgi:hypothetical protein